MHIHRKFWFHFFSRSYALFELRNLAKMKDTTQQFVSATPLKPLNRIFWNFVVMNDIMYTCAYPQDILIQFFFLEQCPFLNFEIWWKWKILLKQLVITQAWFFSALKRNSAFCRVRFRFSVLFSATDLRFRFTDIVPLFTFTSKLPVLEM